MCALAVQRLVKNKLGLKVPLFGFPDMLVGDLTQLATIYGQVSGFILNASLIGRLEPSRDPPPEGKVHFVGNQVSH